MTMFEVGAETPRAGTGGKTILLVDDNAMVRDVLREMLNGGGFEVLEASDGAEALRALKTMRFDAIITDLVMPDCDGIELIRTVRRGFPDMRVLAMSGAPAAPLYLKAARALGAGGTLSKPIDQETLLSAMSGLFEDAA